jgi:hypothetical protein
MKEIKTDEKRRRFLVKLSLGLAGLSAAVAGVPVLSALLAPLLEKTPLPPNPRPGCDAIRLKNLLLFLPTVRI